MNNKQKIMRTRIIIALVLFAIFLPMPFEAWFGYPTGLYVEFGCFLIPYLIAGYDVLGKAVGNIRHGRVFDENFLMSVATIGAFAMVLFPDTEPHMAEGAAVMLFYQVGELFQSYAVDKSRRSIKEMMDIAPEFANVMVDGKLEQVDPFEVSVGDEIVIKPGERIPLDGIVLSGTSQIDTAALTGESVPRRAEPGSEVISGCVNLTGTLTVEVTKPFEDSTVSRILELVENAADKKAKTESFITRFARVYSPAVTIVAVLLAIIPPLLFGQEWSVWVLRGLTFLVVSCPCALVISVPLSFFGGIGGASRLGILVKGSNYLEALSTVDTVVFDKTGTLTDGTFSVTAINPSDNVTEQELMELVAHAEAYSDHPVAASVREAYSGPISHERIKNAEEISGHGIKATIDEHVVLVGNGKLLSREGVKWQDEPLAGTVLYVARDGEFLGSIVIADIVKSDARQAISELHSLGIKNTVMLTGDRKDVALAVANDLGIDEVRYELLPQDKVTEVETLLESQNEKRRLAFVGDGINDAPVLTRADIGIAMGAMGSDAAIEAADIVLMDDRPSQIARAIHLARRTMAIVWQNIYVALGVKFAVLILAAIGIANMWLAVFADVGVAILAILNAMRALNVRRYRSGEDE